MVRDPATWQLQMLTAGGTLTREAKLVLPALPRIIEIVQREHNAWPLQAVIVVLVPVQHGQGRCLPFMDVQNVWLRA